MRAWNLPTPLEIPPSLADDVGGHPLVAETLFRRGMRGASAARQFLDPDEYTPCPPWELPGMKAAVDRVEQSIRRGETICVWGDFDVDGQTSTTVLVSCLRNLGADVQYHIPVRARESHGVGLLELRRVLDAGARLVLTCDTGIGAQDAVLAARQCGVDLVITDHHALPEPLPDAAAVVNPHLLPPGHPLEYLPGVGVAWKLAEALSERFGRPGAEQEWMDLAALGIVADLAGLAGDTRWLLQRGLRALRSTRRAGLLAMMELAEILPSGLTEEQIGFGLGPRLNALGRLADANLAVELLSTEDKQRAAGLAGTLETLNGQRRTQTRQVYLAACELLAADPALLTRPAIILAQKAWPAGTIGIVASRLVERYGKPVILIACPPGELAKGSARSVEGCDITTAIGTQRDLLAGFGGHPMAAGMSLAAEAIPAFTRGVNQAVLEQLGETTVEPVLQIDALVPLAECSLELAGELERLAPFGPLNPALVLMARSLEVESAASLGKGAEHRRVVVRDTRGRKFPVTWWQGAEEELPQGPFDLAYNLRATSFRGSSEVSLEWIAFRNLRSSEVRVEQLRAPFSIHDYRAEMEPFDRLQPLLRQPEVLIWREGHDRERIAGVERGGLTPCQHLVVWTAPPGMDELRAALQKTQPQEVSVFALQVGFGTADELLKRLEGIVRYTVRQYAGILDVDRVAGVTGHRAGGVRCGLRVLASQGKWIFNPRTDGQLEIAPGGEADPIRESLERAALVSEMSETAAYRAYFLRANLETLLVADLSSSKR